MQWHVIVDDSHTFCKNKNSIKCNIVWFSTMEFKGILYNFFIFFKKMSIKDTQHRQQHLKNLMENNRI